jgi:ATP-dependent RNA helicase DDX21
MPRRERSEDEKETPVVKVRTPRHAAKAADADVPPLPAKSPRPAVKKESVVEADTESKPRETKKTRHEAKPADGEEAPNNGSVGQGRPLSDFDLSKETVSALEKIGVATLFPVQALTYKAIRDGKDILVQSRTGSGKTLAFGIPIVEKLSEAPNSRGRGRGPAAVVFCPTRELAIQVKDVILSISRNYIVTALYGGVAYALQERILAGGVDVVVATPGRAKDLLEKGTLKFDRVQIAVLDEADHMLDIGFKDDIELLLRKVAEQNGSTAAGKNTHQTLLFSATIPDWVHTCSFISKNKEFVDMVGRDTVKTANTIKFYRRKVNPSEISSMLADLIRVYSGKHGRTLVFTNTKKDCHDMSISNAKIDAQCLHGDMQQEQRESTMKSFRENKFSVLIATDVAARGLDLPMVDLVIQAAPPADIDAFIHRAGRTGRAGRKGVCVLLHSLREEYIVEKIERHAKMKFEVLPAPTRDSILKAVARDVTEDLARVERRATELFREQAELLLKEADPVEILASALAVMSGYTSTITKRGLLTGTDDNVTVQLTSQHPLPTPVYCSILRTNLGDDLFMRCRDITLLQDTPGCVFDVPEQFIDQVLKTSIRGMEMAVIDTLPPVIARALNTVNRGNARGPAGFGGRGGGGFHQRGGFGGRGFGGRGGGSFRGGAPFSTRRY